MSNPFDLVYEAICDGVGDVVSSTNLIRFDADTFNPEKETIGDADLPELIVFNDGCKEVNLHYTSSSAKFVRTYTLLISTGDLRLNRRLNPVEWDLVCAVEALRSSIMSLTWMDNRFVKRVDLLSSTSAITDEQRNRHLKGWSAVWSLEIEMIFSNSHLTQEESSSSS